jgi:hypothetical protein
VLGKARLRSILILAAAGALVAAACADDGGSDDSATTDEVTDEVTDEFTDEAAGERTGSGDSGEDILLDNGRIVIPEQDVGDVDLTQLPIGDDKVSEAPERGFVYVCPGQPEGMSPPLVDGPWISGDTFNLLEKVWDPGDVDWSEATFDISLEGDSRVLSGNNLPTDTQTGTFPIPSDSEAYTYDRNPNSISAQDYSLELPANPVEADEATCVGGEVGVLLTGVVLFNAFDAGYTDAVAHLMLDKCQGHPQSTGIYHYHMLSTCLEDIEDAGSGHSNLIGYAFDGFGIYGHRGEGGVVLTNDDLDECHGHTHTIDWDGQQVEMYHYHATWEFPYVVGCYRAESQLVGPFGA